mmetsp:Transcript_64034/g.111559  ORF Transcript_64034/g.111559 Transcript_64034/m.111559 type:complete len:406 (-) Transcript_64034:77-1294(-)
MFGAHDVSGSLPTNGDGTLRDVDGRTLQLPEMCAQSLIFFCTFKAVGCPVCPEQLRRLMREPCRSFFKQRMVRFVVLCPGPVSGLKASRDSLLPDLDGEDVPFICDEDLMIARSVNAKMGFSQIVPCFFEVKSDLTVGWTQVGRGPGYFGDQVVMRFVDEQMMRAWITAETRFHEFKRGVSELQSMLESASGKDGSFPLLPPGVLESCLQFLAPADRECSSLSCTEWRVAVARAAQKDVEVCLHGVQALRENTSSQIPLNGFGGVARPYKYVRMKEDGRVGQVMNNNKGIVGLRLLLQQDGRLGQWVTTAAESLEEAPWPGISVPKLDATSELLTYHLAMLQSLGATPVARPEPVEPPAQHCSDQLYDWPPSHLFVRLAATVGLVSLAIQVVCRLSEGIGSPSGT